jgi:hypothetical protein
MIRGHRWRGDYTLLFSRKQLCAVFWRCSAGMRDD